MRVSAVNNYTYHQRSNPGFKGLLIDKGSSSDSWEYQGEISSSSDSAGNYSGSDDYETYVYYPFRGEPEHIIEANIRKHNYSHDYSSMGYGGGRYVSTTRGKTLPYTEKEWNRLSKVTQERIKELL